MHAKMWRVSKNAEQAGMLPDERTVGVNVVGQAEENVRQSTTSNVIENNLFIMPV